MPRTCQVYLDDILEAIGKIESYTKGMSRLEFQNNPLVADAVARNLGIIGEAVKKLPADLKRKHPEIEWKKIAGLRDLLVHEYFGINMEIIWDITTNKIPQLKESIKKITKELKRG